METGCWLKIPEGGCYGCISVLDEVEPNKGGFDSNGFVPKGLDVSAGFPKREGPPPGRTVSVGLAPNNPTAG